MDASRTLRMATNLLPLDTLISATAPTLKLKKIHSKNPKIIKLMKTFKLKQGYKIQEIAEEKVLFPVDMANVDFTNMLVLNTTSTFLIQMLLEKAYSKEELATALADQFDVDHSTAESDIEELINTLQNLHILDTDIQEA